MDCFASSGGAVNSLALVAKHPDDVLTLVAHEPPLASLVPDREYALAACRAVNEAYMQRGSGAGMAAFIGVVSHDGPFTPEFLAQPLPDPAMFGMPAEDDGSRNDPMFSQTILTIPAYEPDFDALRAASTRIVMAAGEGSDGHAGKPRRLRGCRSDWARSRPSSRAVTMASWVASTARPVSPTPSPPSCATCSAPAT